MSDKDFVAMEINICPVCGETHTHNTGILLHKQLKEIPEKNKITGYGLCESDEKRFKEGYLALIVIKNGSKDQKIKFEDADRTGTIIHVKRDVFANMVDTPIKDDEELMFIDEEMEAMIKEIVNGSPTA